MEPTKITVETSANLAALKETQAELGKTAAAGQELGKETTAAAQATDGLTVGGKELAEELKNTKKAADAATESKKQLKDGVKGVGKAFHGLAGIGKMMFHPMMLATYAVGFAVKELIGWIQELYSKAGETASMERLAGSIDRVQKAQADAQGKGNDYLIKLDNISTKARTAADELARVNHEIARQRDEQTQALELEKELALAKAQQKYGNDPIKLAQEELRIEQEFIGKKKQIALTAEDAKYNAAIQAREKARQKDPELTAKFNAAQKEEEEALMNKAGYDDKLREEEIDKRRKEARKKQLDAENYLTGLGPAAAEQKGMSWISGTRDLDKANEEMAAADKEYASLNRSKFQADQRAKAAKNKTEKAFKELEDNREMMESDVQSVERETRQNKSHIVNQAGTKSQIESVKGKTNIESAEAKLAKEAQNLVEELRRDAQAEAEKNEKRDIRESKKIRELEQRGGGSAPKVSMNEKPMQEAGDALEQIVGSVESFHIQYAEKSKGLARRVENLERQRFLIDGKV